MNNGECIIQELDIDNSDVSPSITNRGSADAWLPAGRIPGTRAGSHSSRQEQVLGGVEWSGVEWSGVEWTS
jgi:hypothetical protein